MAINNYDSYVASRIQHVFLQRQVFSAARNTSTGAQWLTARDQSTQPGPPADLKAGNTANGVVPTDATSGFPIISFSSGTGYLVGAIYNNTSNGRTCVFDRLFHAGEFAFGDGTSSLTSQPSYSSRVPGSDYSGLQIWIEVTTAFLTGANWSITVTYTDQDGHTGHTTGAYTGWTAALLAKGRCFQMPLASGDCGVQKIESVVVTHTSTAFTAGGFNVMVIRPLWYGRNDGNNAGIFHTNMPQVYSDSAIDAMVFNDVSTHGHGYWNLAIASG